MDEQTTVIQALNNLQSWLNAGEYKRVIQGCQEVLNVEPGNQRALSLMKQAEERRHETMSQEAPKEPISSIPAPTPEVLAPQSMPVMPAQHTPLQNDPLASLEVETTRPPINPTNPVTNPYGLGVDDDVHSPNKFKIFLAIFIPALLVILIAGGAIFFLMNREGGDEEITTVLEEISSNDYLKENEKRVENLRTIGRVVEEFKNENGAYPSVDQIEDVILKSDYFDELPIDPRHNGIDNSGNTFGYIYAVYKTGAGDNTAYVISALFEDSEGFGYPWTQGGSPRNFPDYMDLDQENVVLIGANKPKIKR